MLDVVGIDNTNRMIDFIIYFPFRFISPAEQYLGYCLLLIVRNTFIFTVVFTQVT